MTVFKNLGNCFEDDMYQLMGKGNNELGSGVVGGGNDNGVNCCRQEEKGMAAASDGPSVSCAAGLASIPVPAKRRRSLKIFGDAVVDPEYCYEALFDYTNSVYKWGKIEPGDAIRDLKLLRLRAMKHLAAEGWRFRYVMEREKEEMQYGALSGEMFDSLFAACKFCIDESRVFRQASASTRRLEEGVFARKKFKNERSSSAIVVKKNPGAFQNGEKRFGKVLKEGKVIGFVQNSMEMVLHSKPKPHNTLSLLIDNEAISLDEAVSYILGDEVMATGKIAREGIKCDCCGDIFGLTNFEVHAGSTYRRPTANIFLSDGRSLLDCKLEVVRGTTSEGLESSGLIEKAPLKVKPYKYGRRFKKGSPALIKPPVTASSAVQQNPRTVLSWLVDNDVVLPREKVTYVDKKDGSILASGKVTREGIKCKCCSKIFSLTGFKVHAGCTDQQPAANIFLSDGRSLLECQLKALRLSEGKGLVPQTIKRVKRDQVRPHNEDMCSICHFGGHLMRCDYCFSLFHLACVGLEDVPQGRWCCPLCRCAICSQGETSDHSETINRCHQCERIFHVGCVPENEETRREHKSQESWFCSKRCLKVYDKLHELVGKSTPTGVKGLTWTILRSKVDYITNSNDTEVTAEHHSKLWVAVNMLHECFVPIIEPHSRRDLVTDVLFNKRSEYQYLNFWGFYTMLLERGDELISVATVRIYGEKVAEVPLVATCIQYRFQGMCRVLVQELEKMLAGLGVERLIVHAVPQMLNAWTNSFGFSQVDWPERLNLLEYRFLDFKDTVMCQKLLKTSEC